MKQIVKQLLFDIGWHLTEQARQEQRGNSADLRSLHQLSELGLESYLPWTQAALRPSAVRVCLNELAIHERRSVIEFGSGVSTLMIARFLDRNGGSLVSIENSIEWRDKVGGYLDEMGIDQSVCKLVHCPLSDAFGKEYPQWYNADKLRSQIADRTFDVALVDGPRSCTRETAQARHPALPFIFNQLENDFCILLDDVKRRGEHEVAKMWAAEYNLTLEVDVGNSGLGLLRPRNERVYFGIG